MGWHRALIGKGATADAGADWGVVEWGDWHVGLWMMIWLVVYESPRQMVVCQVFWELLVEEVG
jgi:hypothetical protein